MAQTLIEAQDVRKTYFVQKKRLDVLRGVTLGVREGEAVAVIGSSGAGKTTLLQILGGLDRPTHGRVLFAGSSVYDSPQAARSRLRGRHMGFVFQSYHLLPELDVVENVMLPAMSGLGPLRGPSAMRARACELLNAVGLAPRANHTPMELSGGEQQRVALARALMNAPSLVLADEPTGNLDRETGAQVLGYLFDLTKGSGRTLVVVTHDDAVARRCDRIIRLAEGRVADTAPA